MQERPDHAPDPDPEVARRRTGRWLVGVLLGTFLLGAAGGVAGFVAGLRNPRSDNHFSFGALIALLTALALILVAAGLVLWQLLNLPYYQRVRQYHWRRRMRVAKALRRGDPISPDDLAVADAVVAAMRKQRLVFWTQPLLIASWILIAFTRHGFGRWLYVCLALVLSSALVYAVRVHRRSLRNWDALSNRPAGDPPQIGS